MPQPVPVRQAADEPADLVGHAVLGPEQLQPRGRVLHLDPEPAIDVSPEPTPRFERVGLDDRRQLLRVPGVDEVRTGQHRSRQGVEQRGHRRLVEDHDVEPTPPEALVQDHPGQGAARDPDVGEQLRRLRLGHFVEPPHDALALGQLLEIGVQSGGRGGLRGDDLIDLGDPPLGLRQAHGEDEVPLGQLAFEGERAHFKVQRGTEPQEVLPLIGMDTPEDGPHRHVHGGVGRGDDQHAPAFPHPAGDGGTDRGRLARAGRPPEQVQRGRRHLGDRRALILVEALEVLGYYLGPGRQVLLVDPPGDGAGAFGDRFEELAQRPQDEGRVERHPQELGVGGQGLAAFDDQSLVVRLDHDRRDRVPGPLRLERHGLVGGQVDRGGEDQAVDEVAGLVGEVLDGVDVEPGGLHLLRCGGDLGPYRLPDRRAIDRVEQGPRGRSSGGCGEGAHQTPPGGIRPTADSFRHTCISGKHTSGPVGPPVPGRMRGVKSTVAEKNVPVQPHGFNMLTSTSPQEDGGLFDASKRNGG